MRAFKSVFGDSKPKRPATPSNRNGTSGDPLNIQPPFVQGPFSRPSSYTSYTFAPTLTSSVSAHSVNGTGTEDFTSAQVPSVRVHPPSESSGVRPPQYLQSIPEIPVTPLPNSAVHSSNLVSTYSPPLAERPHAPSVLDRSPEANATTATSTANLRPPVKRSLTIKSADVTGWQEQFELAQAAKSIPQSSGAAHPDQEKDASSDKEFVAIRPVHLAPTSQPPLGLQFLASRQSSAPVSLHSPTWDGRGAAPPDEPTQTTNDAIGATAGATASLPSTSPAQEHLSKPTCSLNLMCYRPGYQGCVLKQITVIGRSRYTSEEAYREALLKHKDSLISSDEDFFRALRTTYMQHMCSHWRRHFSMKTLHQIRLLSVRTPNTGTSTVLPDQADVS
jgi:hypothetical protein